MEAERPPSSSSSFAPTHTPELLRRRLLEFLLHSSLQLQVPPNVKYTALSFFSHRFLIRLHARRSRSSSKSWLLQPLRESNLQLFALVSIWISSKIHDSRPLSVKSLKALGDRLISDQHFTTRDFAQAELVFMEVLGFEIGASSIAFNFLEDLHIQFRELSKLGDLVTLDVCMEIMDLLHETECTSVLFLSPFSLAASIIVSAYLISVPKQQWEFPLLPWLKFATPYTEEEIGELVTRIIAHVLQTDANEQIEEAFQL